MIERMEMNEEKVKETKKGRKEKGSNTEGNKEEWKWRKKREESHIIQCNGVDCNNVRPRKDSKVEICIIIKKPRTFVCFCTFSYICKWLW